MFSKIDRLELCNFKSFAGTITVGPLKDFTCIVGPNGSGKSNLMDALCFVLSSNPTETLRGRRATDFIHRGAQDSGCHVTVVLRHTTARTDDGSTSTSAGGKNVLETAFTRAVTSNGRITNKVNGKVTTEKEFVSMLNKFNMGPRVNNFLVFQHDVESVAQKKAIELTELLEQVSGSNELKAEYDLCKKAHELANHELVEASVAKREAVAALNQARHHQREAERCQEVMKRITEEKRNEALVQLFHIETDLDSKKQELDNLNTQLRELEQGVTADEEWRRLKREYAEKHKAYLEELKQSRRDADALREKHATHERIKTSLAHLNRKRELQRHELDRAAKTESIQTRETQRIEEQLRQQKALLSSFVARCQEEDKTHKTISSALNSTQLQEYRQLRKEAECQTVVLRQQLDRVKRQQQSLIEGQKRCALAIENARLQKEDLVNEIQRGNGRISQLQNREVELQGVTEEITGKISQKQTELGMIEKRNTERGVKLAKIQDQLHELRFMKESDKHDSKMAVALQGLRSLHGIRGRLVDLCTIPNDRYRQAVTVAFGKNLEAVVVDTTETAIACVRYLREQRLPPMTFLPLDSVRGKTADDRLRTLGGTCKPIVDVIRYDVSIELAVQYALGQTLVCDTMSEARQIAYGRADGQRFKVVTIDGTVLMRNGVVQGGLAAVQSRARKWDEKRYSELQAAREQLLSDAAGDSEAEVARAQCELRDMSSRLEFSRSRIQVVQAELQLTAQKVLNMEQSVQKQESELSSLEGRHSAYSAELKLCEEEIERTRASILQVENKVFGEFEARVEVFNLAELERNEALQAKERAEKQQQLQLLIHRLEMSLETEQKRLGLNSVSEVSAILGRLEKEIHQHERDLSSYSKILKDTEGKLELSRSRVSETKRELDKMELNMHQYSRNTEKELNQLALVRRGIAGLQAACDTLRLRRVNVINRCQVEDIDIPLKPVEAAGTKRRRPPEGEVTRVSEPFSILNEPSPSQLQSARGTKPSSSQVSTASQVVIDFSGLSEALVQVASDKAKLEAYKQRTETLLITLQRAMETLAPNIKAAMQLSECEEKLSTSSAVFEAAREKANTAYASYTKVKKLRTQRFMDTFEKIADHVDRIYRALTMGTRGHMVHGSAYLTVEDVEEPYCGGTTYHATPPMKRYMPMELLSGGERTMAALALLFAVHAVSPTPFFVLDEVDAALDAGNVERLANYTRNNCTTTQFIVISLKDQLYHMADMLVGVLKDKQKESSSVLSVDLRGYPF
ncbi:putative structural maintenance of chromosome (SMC) family protein [Trypanosoma vivax]|uniref:Structural maintenance of chromosomes protein n=1 Tax=Trypanosoma vivax (strain Y486) TaxID=1055687 RepID=G0U381_TRYVY|nr:putative structural maintenance of chromosome (SMC) family protein [Trypanosoma vivax]CCC50736.1 putative structural maintenance of chromosome (SMC) family protein [Trypanosoma vivax Y486]